MSNKMGRYELGLPNADLLRWYLDLGLEETFEFKCTFEYLHWYQVKVLLDWK